MWMHATQKTGRPCMRRQPAVIQTFVKFSLKSKWSQKIILQCWRTLYNLWSLRKVLKCFSGADILAVNADQSISFDICEERSECLFYLQNEMRRAGITQKDIDKARKSQELSLIEHCKELRSRSSKFTMRQKKACKTNLVKVAKTWTSRMIQKVLQYYIMPLHMVTSIWLGFYFQREFKVEVSQMVRKKRIFLFSMWNFSQSTIRIARDGHLYMPLHVGCSQRLINLVLIKFKFLSFLFCWLSVLTRFFRSSSYWRKCPILIPLWGRNSMKDPLIWPNFPNVISYWRSSKNKRKVYQQTLQKVEGQSIDNLTEGMNLLSIESAIGSTM